MKRNKRELFESICLATMMTVPALLIMPILIPVIWWVTFFPEEDSNNG